MAQLFYGKLSSVSPVGNGSNSYIRVRFDATTSSTTLTNVTDVSGYLGIDYVRVGQQLVESSAFPSGTTITAVDVANNTITVEDNPATAESQGLGRVSPAEGDYYIPSASITDPQGIINFNDITGSNDSDFGSDGTTFAILGQAANSSQNLINGRFHKYTISEVLYRNAAGSEGSIYVTWGEKGSQSDSGDELYESANQNTLIVELSPSESLAPIFTRNLTGMQNLNVGQETAGYQIELENFFDDLVQTDIYYTGSLVSKNNAEINFTGSGVTVTASGSEGILVNIASGGGGDAFPYSGNAQITGSLNISGSTRPLQLNDIADVTAQEEYLFSGSNSTDVFTLDRTQYLGFTLDYIVTDEADSQRIGTFRAHFPSSSNVMFDDTSTTVSGNIVSTVGLSVVNDSGDDVDFRISRVSNDTDIKIQYFRKVFIR